jgi:hypothetical protein
MNFSEALYVPLFVTVFKSRSIDAKWRNIQGAPQGLS